MACALAIVLLGGCSEQGSLADGSVSPVDSETVSPPNIVIFLVDALRADRLNCYGYEDRLTSPRLDELAAEGVLFENAYAPAPWTLPSLASIMTSSWICEHGVVTDKNKLPESMLTLAEYLRDRGYKTLGLYGNVYAGPDFGLDQGYDVYEFSLRNDAQAVSRVLHEETEEPFFLYVHNMEPHSGERYSGPRGKGFPEVSDAVRTELKERAHLYRKLTRRDFVRGQELGTTINTRNQIRELSFMSEAYEENSILYDGAIQLADSRIGSVVDWLRESGRWENTVFIFTSDHGEELGDHGGWQHDQSVYEELVRIPLIIRMPKSWDVGGSRVDRIVSLVDLFPTLIDLVEPAGGVGVPVLKGQSFLRYLSGRVEQDGNAGFTIPALRINRKKYFRPWKESRGDVNVVIRKGSMKGILNVENETFELYDLAADPDETTDLSGQMNEVSTELAGVGERWFLRCAEQGAANSSLSDATREQLKALGYVD